MEVFKKEDVKNAMGILLLSVLEKPDKITCGDVQKLFNNIPVIDVPFIPSGNSTDDLLFYCKNCHTVYKYSDKEWHPYYKYLNVDDK